MATSAPMPTLASTTEKHTARSTRSRHNTRMPSAVSRSRVGPAAAGLPRHDGGPQRGDESGGDDIRDGVDEERNGRPQGDQTGATGPPTNRRTSS